MAWYFKCKPDFNDMEFYEFMTKYDKLRERIKKEKGNNKTMDLLEGFRNLTNRE